MFEYLDFLQTPNPTFNNMPICPFIAGDLQTGNIKFMVYTSDMDKSLIEIIKEWRRGTYWFYYKQNNKIADEGVYRYCTKVLGFTKKQIFK